MLVIWVTTHRPLKSANKHITEGSLPAQSVNTSYLDAVKQSTYDADLQQLQKRMQLRAGGTCNATNWPRKE
jgi:hypothetical protein